MSHFLELPTAGSEGSPGDSFVSVQFLHDHVCSHLAVMKMQLSHMCGRAKSKSQKRDLDSIGEVIDELIASIRCASKEARQAAEFLLYREMKGCICQFEERTGIHTLFKSTGTDTGISTEICLAVYAILEEALANVVRHASAKAVRVEAERHDTFLMVSIRDNGIGMHKSRNRNTDGFGLYSVTQRIRAHGGTVHAGPGPAGGFEVVFRVPLVSRSSVRAGAGMPIGMPVRRNSSLSGNIAQLTSDICGLVYAAKVRSESMLCSAGDKRRDRGDKI